MEQIVKAAKLDTTLLNWKVKEGDKVRKGDWLCTVLLGNMKREVSSKFNGTIQKINFHENDAVPGGSTICVIDAEEEKPVGAVTVNPGDIVPIILAKIGGSSATVKK